MGMPTLPLMVEEAESAEIPLAQYVICPSVCCRIAQTVLA
jgi:hypothetical protein